MADTYTEIDVIIGLKSGGEQCITYQPARDEFTQPDTQLIIHVNHSKDWTETITIASDNISFVRSQIREIKREPERPAISF